MAYSQDTPRTLKALSNKETEPNVKLGESSALWRPREAEAGISQGQGQPGLQNNFKLAWSILEDAGVLVYTATLALQQKRQGDQKFKNQGQHQSHDEASVGYMRPCGGGTNLTPERLKYILDGR